MRTRRRPGERPVWAARHVDAPVEWIQPLPGWVLLEERFVERQTPNGLVLVDAPGTVNTVTGKVLAVHKETAQELGISPGDTIVLREWSGGRWAFQGKPTLLTSADDILAKFV